MDKQDLNASLSELATKKTEAPTPTVPLPATPVQSATLSKSPTKKTYYARLDGCRYVFQDGGVAVFVGGRFEFDPAVVPEDYMPLTGKTPEEGWAQRHKELEYQVNTPNPVFSKVPVEIQRTDAHVLREVGHAGGGVGLVTSFQAQALLANGAQR